MEMSRLKCDHTKRTINVYLFFRKIRKSVSFISDSRNVGNLVDKEIIFRFLRCCTSLHSQRVKYPLAVRNGGRNTG